MTKIRPFLKWAGSKYNCLHQVISSLPPGQRLIEPFAGSGVIFMNTNYPAYLMGESNSDLVHLFNTLKNKGLFFVDYCKQFFEPEMNCKEKYYELRDAFNKINKSQKKSAMFLYLNRHGYNGLCRYNSKGIYNVPFGLYTKPYFPHQEMLLFHQKSAQAEFIHNDFRKTFQMAEKGDVIYCDPPYVPITIKNRPLPYTQKNFSDDDQIELAELARATADRGIPVIISNHDTEFTREHYKNAQIKSFQVSRLISCQSERRLPVNELIAVFK
ncbi:Dam family site-specific DNA-(adenine-N6)-methyltransferase [Legionella worsleiensis]|uniref:Site-specific DNA-methyltransferase (adenine-specific) n=1 Tax=Legionella worsleiensis TaxID=45076 RepID=A0A0W1A491_9GAMM|nr:Dam family site-specific DNA-(adenine-N6)-methyltransferase [Legionella worsleiensis]KTD75827.1 DNA adenine methylase [Legionella worsleiensis]STY32839.1 DNA adenine methylase [Legionella worsleiensis]